MRIGPKPAIWRPTEIPDKILDQVSRSIDMTFSGQKNQQSLAVVPLPDFTLKMLVKFMKFADEKARGGVVDSTLAILFEEMDDTIFYKYMRDFEALFQECGKKLITNEEEKGPRATTDQIIVDFNEKIHQLIEKLRTHEVDPMEPAAFPQTAERESGKERRRFKIIIVGDPSVGKTSMILQFTDKAFRRTYIPTLGTNISEKSIEYPEFRADLVLWDIAGQSKFSRFRSHFYSGANGFLLIFDLTNPETFASIPGWFKDINKELNNVPGIIIANKHDLVKDRKISDDAIQKLSQELKCKIVITSAMTGENVETAFKELAETLYNLHHKVEQKILSI